MVVQNGIMKSGIALFTFEVYVIGVSYLFQDIFHIIEYPFITGQHERSHSLLVIVP